MIIYRRFRHCSRPEVTLLLKKEVIIHHLRVDLGDILRHLAVPTHQPQAALLVTPVAVMEALLGEDSADPPEGLGVHQEEGTGRHKEGTEDMVHPQERDQLVIPRGVTFLRQWATWETLGPRQLDRSITR